jgi:Peptidase M15
MPGGARADLSRQVRNATVRVNRTVPDVAPPTNLEVAFGDSPTSDAIRSARIFPEHLVPTAEPTAAQNEAMARLLEAFARTTPERRLQIRTSGASRRRTRSGRPSGWSSTARPRCCRRRRRRVRYRRASRSRTTICTGTTRSTGRRRRWRSLRWTSTARSSRTAGGADASRHLEGLAADVHIPSSMTKIRAAANECGSLSWGRSNRIDFTWISGEKDNRR